MENMDGTVSLAVCGLKLRSFCLHDPRRYLKQHVWHMPRGSHILTHALIHKHAELINPSLDVGKTINFHFVFFPAAVNSELDQTAAGFSTAFLNWALTILMAERGLQSHMSTTHRQCPH